MIIQCQLSALLSFLNHGWMSVSKIHSNLTNFLEEYPGYIHEMYNSATKEENSVPGTKILIQDQNREHVAA